LSRPLTNHRPLVPRKLLPSPNIRPQPRMKKASEEHPKTMKFFARMFTQFFARARPDSTIAKPRFMKNTRKAVSRTHIVSMAILVFAICSAIAAVKTAGASAASSVCPRLASARTPSAVAALMPQRRR
jgi:hypothetical protein